MSKNLISDEDFVVAYMLCSTYHELAVKLGYEDVSVQARAAKLRKAGVKLVPYERKKKKIDVKKLSHAELVKLINEKETNNDE